jgi:hypothetical protein
MIVYNKFAILHKFTLWTYKYLLFYSIYFVLHLYICELFNKDFERLYTIEWIDLEGSGHSIIEVPSWYLPVGTEGNHGKPQLG